MARLATRTAKPDGQCFIPAEKVRLGVQYMQIFRLFINCAAKVVKANLFLKGGDYKTQANLLWSKLIQVQDSLK